MIRIHQSASAAQAKQYYTQALGRPDYYGRDGASPGTWFGKGAERLGLTGDVQQAEFFALIDNRHPTTGQRLTVRDRTDRRPGWDIVFSPPKSVSVLRAFGDERIRDALVESATETLSEIEAEAVRTRLRRGGQQGTATTGNLVASLFFHDTTRELADGRPDPHDHLHAYIHNVTWGAEGRWQAAELYTAHVDRPYYEAAFEARLGKKLVALGYQLERHASGWEVAGVPESAIRKLSRRTAEIEATAARLGITDAAEKGQLGARTRRAKGDPLPAPELRRYWQDQLTGDERHAVTETLARAALGPVDPHGPTAEQALAHATGHLFERNSTALVRAEVLAEALRYGVGSVTPEGARSALVQRPLLTAEIDGRLVATLPEVASEERRLIRFARDGRGRYDPLGGWGTHAVKRERLNTGQRRAVAALLGSFDRVQILAGKAGVGKSTLLAEVRDGIEAHGRRVIAVAPTTGAAAVLRKDGFTADTIALLLASEPLQRQIAGNVLLVDEAGLVGTRTMARLFDLAERHGARVILSGDSGQHAPPGQRGTALRLLEERAGLKAAGVSEIVRQVGRLKEAVAALGRGDGGDGFDRLDALGAVREIADGHERYHQLAVEYADALEGGREALCIAPTHAEGARATDAIRTELRNRGRIGEGEGSVLRLISADLTEQQRRDAAQYHPGDVVQFSQNAPGRWVRGARVTVTGTNGAAVRVVTATGEERLLPLESADRFQVYRPSALRVSPGDRVRVTQNGSTPDKRRLVNGSVYTVRALTPEGDLVLNNGWTVPQNYGHLAPGWTVTSHASQGRTVSGSVFIAQSAESLPASSLEQFYVSASRVAGSGEVRVFTDNKAALRQAVSRSDRPLSATELLERRPGHTHVSSALLARLRHLRYLATVYARLGLERVRGRVAGLSDALPQAAAPQAANRR